MPVNHPVIRADDLAVSVVKGTYVRPPMEDFAAMVSSVVAVRTGWRVRSYKCGFDFRPPDMSSWLAQILLDEVDGRWKWIAQSFSASKVTYSVPAPGKSLSADIDNVVRALVRNIISDKIDLRLPDWANSRHTIPVTVPSQSMSGSSAADTVEIAEVVYQYPELSVRYHLDSHRPPAGVRISSSKATIPSTLLDVQMMKMLIQDINTLHFDNGFPSLHAVDIVDKLTAKAQDERQRVRHQCNHLPEALRGRRDKLVASFVDMECNPTSMIEYPAYFYNHTPTWDMDYEAFIGAFTNLLGADDWIGSDALAYYHLLVRAEDAWDRVMRNLTTGFLCAPEDESREKRHHKLLALATSKEASFGERSNSYQMMFGSRMPSVWSEPLSALVSAGRDVVIAQLGQHQQSEYFSASDVAEVLTGITFPTPSSPKRKELSAGQKALTSGDARILTTPYRRTLLDRLRRR